MPRARQDLTQVQGRRASPARGGVSPVGAAILSGRPVMASLTLRGSDRRTTDVSESTALNGPLRAIIADDDAFARRVIRDSLEKAGVTVVAEARNGRQAVELVIYYRPDVVLMDVVMPELDGILATRRILKELPEQLVIMLTGTDDDEDDLGIQAIQAGATGFLSKDVDIEALPRALEAVWAGEAAISRKMTRRLIERLRRAPNGSTRKRPRKSPPTAPGGEGLDHLPPGLSARAVPG